MRVCVCGSKYTFQRMQEEDGEERKENNYKNMFILLFTPAFCEPRKIHSHSHIIKMGGKTIEKWTKERNKIWIFFCLEEAKKKTAE